MKLEKTVAMLHSERNAPLHDVASSGVEIDSWTSPYFPVPTANQFCKFFSINWGVMGLTLSKMNWYQPLQLYVMLHSHS